MTQITKKMLLKHSLSLLLAGFISIGATANEVSITLDGLRLNGELNMALESHSDGPMVLIVHGTLAHNSVEIVTTLQELLADEDLNSLAINLSLGLDDRHGSYECSAPHQHRHQDASKEISAWIEWLKKQGTEKVIVVGHSRGGSQVASYSQQADSSVIGQVLVAPMTWSAKYAAEAYESRYQQSLASILTIAHEQQGVWMPDKTSFIYCEDAPKVSVESFLSYYEPTETLNTPDLLITTTLPTVVIAGSEDKVIKDLPQQMARLDLPAVDFLIIDGADHYFRDLYADDVVEAMLNLIERTQ
jgi:pimeloyl-ACP methyl ester carboxylesterase